MRGLGSRSSYGIVRSRSKIANFFGGGTTDRKSLTNNRNQEVLSIVVDSSYLEYLLEYYFIILCQTFSSRLSLERYDKYLP